ncbi:MAG: hypothetical protein GXP08_12365 [Gammaproteobacteria bacterium]|nr:hypothetical protein [Gammaproteobacteria bacterium]
MPFLALANNDQDEIDTILNLKTSPFGVVFEIVEGDDNALRWAIPQVAKFSAQLKAKFPDIGIAVVTHGKEQFALMTQDKGKYRAVHKIVKSLTQNQDIPVHVCGTHASWFGKKKEDFPSYVDVTPAAPTQIRHYEDMGYEKIVLDQPQNHQ